MKKQHCKGCDRFLPEDQFEALDYYSVTGEWKFGTRCKECAGESGMAVPAGLDEDPVDEDEDGKSPAEREEEVLSRKLAAAAQMDLKLLAAYTASKFRRKLENRAPDVMPDFVKLKTMAAEVITREMGLNFPRELRLPPGNYIVIGDSHGTYVQESLIKCVERMAEHFRAKVIHVGHVIDRQKDEAEPALAIPGLTVVAVADEIYHLSLLQEQYPGFSIVRERIVIGDSVLVRNQHDRGDFVRNSVKNMRLSESGYDYIIVDSHLHEVHSLCKNRRQAQHVSPGCMCERHPHRKPRRIPKTADAELLACSLEATFAGRRQNELNRYWENGVTLVCMPPKGHATVVNCRAKQIGKKFFVGYAGLIFSEDGVKRADQVGLVVGDTHVSRHDPEICSIVDRAAKELAPDYLINLGDHWDCRSLNHHLIDRDEYVDTQIVSEFGKGHELLRMMGEWTAGEKHIFVGNHGRFVRDFAKKMPQLDSLLNIHVLGGARKLGYVVTEEKGVLEKAGAKFFHGELKMYGTAGDRHQRVHDVMEADCMFGHTHSPSCRLGCYTVGLLGQMDQEYNEVEATAWVHGFGTVATYEGQTFMCTIPIFGRSLRFMGSDIKPHGVKRWRPPEFEAEIVYIPKTKVSAASPAK